MSIQGIVDIGRSALLAQKTALEVTGENVANVNTPGYSRQSVILENVAGSNQEGFSIGRGVKVAAVSRSYDQFLQMRINYEMGGQGQQTVMNDALLRVEQLFNEFTGDGLGKTMEQFFNAWHDLASNPEGNAERQSILTLGKSISEDFKRVNSYLTDIRVNSNQSLVSITDDINGRLQRIAQLNEQISLTEAGGTGANDLRDTRDQLVRELAGKVEISFMERSDGSVNISLARGPQLVEGNKAGVLSLEGDSNNGGLYNVMIAPPGSSTKVDVTSILPSPTGKGGELGATVEMRDTIAAGYQSSLDELAYTLATQMNNLHQSGYGTNGSTGKLFFNAPPAVVPPATFAAGYAGMISVAITSTADIAAASTDPTAAGGGVANNIIAQQLANLQTAPQGFASGTATFTEYYANLVGSVGVAKRDSDQGLKQSELMMKQLDNLRESQSGVSLDEEMANILKFQKAFEGAAKIISTASEMLDTVLNMVR